MPTALKVSESGVLGVGLAGVGLIFLCCVRLRFGGHDWPRRADVAASTEDGVDQAFVLEESQGVLDRGAGDAEASLQLARGGEPFAWAQLAVVDGCAQDVGGLDVRRPGLHEPTDALLGTPLNPATYDYAGAVLFNAHSGALWARFTTYLRRELAARLGMARKAAHAVLRVSFAKVAEYQQRGLVHFHAVIRLDSPDGTSQPPPPYATVTVLTNAVRAAARVSVTVESDAVVELVVIKDLLGHAHVGVTATVYAHVRLRLQRDAIDHP